MYYSDDEHEQLHYDAWERGTFATMDYGVCGIASAVAALLLVGVIPADHPVTAALVVAAFAGWTGWCAHRLQAEHNAYRSELDESGCTEGCWSIQDGLRAPAQLDAR